MIGELAAVWWEPTTSSKAASSAEAHLLSPLLKSQALTTLESPIQLPAASSQQPAWPLAQQEPAAQGEEVGGGGLVVAGVMRGGAVVERAGNNKLATSSEGALRLL